MRPRTLLLLLSRVLVLTETLAGECGVWRERPLRGGARGPPGSLGGRTPGNERPRLPCPEPPPHPGPVLSLPCIPTPLFNPSGVRAGLRPLPSHWPSAPSALPALSPRTRTRAARRYGRVSPLFAPRLPLPEVFLHRRVPARPRGAPLHRRRLRGRHAVHTVRQRRPESKGRTAGAVDGAGGAGVLGSKHENLQGHRTDFPGEPEHRTRLLQPERGR